jgi:hypothetical protein
MPANRLWTEIDPSNFVRCLYSDFIDQITARVKSLKIDPRRARISRLLSSPGSLTLWTMARLALATGAKVAVVLYDDGDAENYAGPIHSDVFRIAWEKQGRPLNVCALVQEPLTEPNPP